MISKPTANPGGDRLECVDALRGFDMLWIIGGGELMKAIATHLPAPAQQWLTSQFDHEWGVFRFYDIIMPLFLFIVGIVMPVAFNRRLQKGESRQSIYKHVLWRVFKLYILGLVASGHLLDFDLLTLKLWTDTLHAIAMGYLISSVLVLELKGKWQVVVTAALLLLYWIIMSLVPVPGHGAGIYERDLNLALYVDDKVLGHFQEGYGWTYILTNLTFVCSVMLGVFAGRLLMGSSKPAHKIRQLCIAGVCCIATGWIWSFSFPVIHHLWTSSLVLFAGGWSFLLLALFYQVIDVWGFRKWAFPFKVIGVNAIAVYVATHLFDFRLIGNVLIHGFEKWLGSWYAVAQALAALLIIWLILYWMYKKKTFIKV